MDQQRRRRRFKRQFLNPLDVAIQREETLISLYELHLSSLKQKSSSNPPPKQHHHLDHDDESKFVIANTPGKIQLPAEEHFHKSYNQVTHSSENAKQKNEALLSSSEIDIRHRDDEDWWSHLFPLIKSQSSYSSPAVVSLALKEPVAPYLLKIQAALVRFEFSNVQFVNQNPVLSRRTYRVSGHFVANTTVQATLLIEFERRFKSSKHDDNAASQHLHNVSTPRITNVDATFNQPWLIEELKASGIMDYVSVQSKNVSSLLHKVAEYIDFDRKRTSFLTEHSYIRNECKGSTTNIYLPMLEISSHQSSIYNSLQHDDDNDARDEDSYVFLALAWSWNWKLETDQLILVSEVTKRASAGQKNTKHSSAGQKKLWSTHELNHLVEITGSCTEALYVMLNLPTCHTTRSESIASAKKKENSTSARKMHKEGPKSCCNEDDTSEDSKGPPKKQKRLSEYELQRLERIKRNEAKFKELGLDTFTPILTQKSENRRKSKS